MESANVKFDEHAEVQDNASIKKLEEYKSFLYFYEGMPVAEEAANQVGNQQQVLVSAESQPVNAELQNEGNAHSDSKISTHERDTELPERDVHSESDAERPKIETRTEPRPSKYVRKHHPTE